MHSGFWKLWILILNHGGHSFAMLPNLRASNRSPMHSGFWKLWILILNHGGHSFAMLPNLRASNFPYCISICLGGFSMYKCSSRVRAGFQSLALGFGTQSLCKQGLFSFRAWGNSLQPTNEPRCFCGHGIVFEVGYFSKWGLPIFPNNFRTF